VLLDIYIGVPIKHLNLSTGTERTNVMYSFAGTVELTTFYHNQVAERDVLLFSRRNEMKCKNTTNSLNRIIAFNLIYQNRVIDLSQFSFELQKEAQHNNHNLNLQKLPYSINFCNPLLNITNTSEKSTPH
jgi:hypothetical protein